MTCTFQATVGGKFAPLSGLKDEDMDIDTMITTYNTAVTNAPVRYLVGRNVTGKSHRSHEMSSTTVMRLFEEEGEVAKEYREVNKRLQKAVKKAKDWIGPSARRLKLA